MNATEYHRLWRKKHPLKWIEYKLRSAARHGTEELRRKKREHYLKNRERYRANRKAYYERNKERIKAKSRAWHQAKPEEAARRRMVYYYRTTQARRDYSKDYYRKHRDEIRAKETMRRAARRNQLRLWARAQSAAITERYAREQLSKNSTVSMSQWPKELVQVKQAQIKVKRLLKET